MEKSEEIFNLVNNNINKIALNGLTAHKEIMINQSFNTGGPTVNDITEIIDIIMNGSIVATLKREQVPDGVHYTISDKEITVICLIQNCFKKD